MELQQLRYFAAAARLGNFTRAAEACGVSQPTLSQQIAKLEQELGRPLFDRGGRGAVLTDAGRAFRERVDRALALIDDGKEALAADAAGGRLVVAAIPTVAPYLLPAALVAFADRFPGARLDVREYTTAECLARVSDGEVDLAVLALPVADPDLEAEPLLTEELLLALPAGHRLATAEGVPLAELADERFVVLHEAHCLSAQSAGFCARNALAPVVTARMHQLGTVLELVRLGHGVSLVPAMAAAADRDPGRVYRRVAGEPPTRTLAAVRSRLRFRVPLAGAFVELLRPAGLAASRERSG